MGNDLYLILKYRLNPEEARITDTNIRAEKLKEILSEYLRTQLGQGEDTSKAEEREDYTIKIGLNLSSDTFTTESNTGNRGLATGIVMRSLEILVIGDSVQEQDNYSRISQTREEAGKRSNSGHPFS